MSTFIYCSNGHRCGVCGSSKDCRESVSGLRFCKRYHQGDRVPGHRYIGESSNGVWGLWRDEQHSGCSSGCSHTPSAPRPQRDPEAEAKAHKRAKYNFESGYKRSKPIDDDTAKQFGKALGLPPALLQSLGAMFADDGKGPTFVLPEFGFNTAGDFVAVCYLWRRLDGSKLNYGDPDVEVKRGLTLCDGWDDNPGPIYVPEGASDAMALHAMGLCAAARPSSRSGMEVLARLINTRPDLRGRDVIILGENDEKSNGRWEGRDGAWQSAQQLADAIGRPVRVAMPPKGTKDVREWFAARWRPGFNPQSLATAFGREFGELRRIFRPTKTAEPTGDCYAAMMRSMILAMVGDLIASKEERDRHQARCQENLNQVNAIMRADRVRYECPCCRKLVMQEKETGIPAVATIRCEHWLCLGCRLYLIGREMTATLYHFHAAEKLYETTCSGNEWPALRRRIQRAGGEFRRIKYRGGWYVVTDALVRGVVPTTAEHAAYEFQETLREWEDDHRPVTSSRGWKLLREESQADLRVIGVADPSLDMAKTAEIAAAVGAVVMPRTGRSDRPAHVVSMWKIHRPAGWDEKTVKRFAHGMMDGFVMPEGMTFEIVMPVRQASIADDLGMSL